VTANRKRWAAKITYDSNRQRLGTFDTKQEAALVYDRAARQCGEDEPLNYESIAAAEEASVQAQAEHILVHDPAYTKAKGREPVNSLRQRPERARARDGSWSRWHEVGGEHWQSRAKQAAASAASGGKQTKTMRHRDTPWVMRNAKLCNMDRVLGTGRSGHASLPVLPGASSQPLGQAWDVEKKEGQRRLITGHSKGVGAGSGAGYICVIQLRKGIPNKTGPSENEGRASRHARGPWAAKRNLQGLNSNGTPAASTQRHGQSAHGPRIKETNRLLLRPVQVKTLTRWRVAGGYR
jgi:hypothetical protein